MYDIIGDIHGHFNELVLLLEKMGYRQHKGTYSHPLRKAIFVGDFVDRGPQIRETLGLVKNMVDAGNALTVMGNHEYNAVCYHTPDGNGSYLRPHTLDNYDQHKHTLEAFASLPDEWARYIEWFKQLPVVLDLADIRVVHASWISSDVRWVKARYSGAVPTDAFFHESSLENSRAFTVVENLLKGLEIDLPDGKHICDKEGKKRDTIRTKWWINPHPGITYDEIAMKYTDMLDSIEVPKGQLQAMEPYPEIAKPVFTGHYWLSGEPRVLRNNICCLDYSVAKGGRLVAYRWQGEQNLNNENFVYVPSEANTDL